MLYYITRLYTLYSLHVWCFFWEGIYMYEITNAREKIQQSQSFLLITKPSLVTVLISDRRADRIALREEGVLLVHGSGAQPSQHTGGGRSGLHRQLFMCVDCQEAGSSCHKPSTPTILQLRPHCPLTAH